MSTPEEIKLYINRFGSEDARILANTIIKHTFPWSADRVACIEALKRLTDMQLEAEVLRALSEDEFRLNTQTMEDGTIIYSLFSGTNIPLTYESKSVRDVVVAAADHLLGHMSPKLEAKVRPYLTSQALGVDGAEQKLGPAIIRKGEGS